jgi:arylsulfatase
MMRTAPARLARLGRRRALAVALALGVAAACAREAPPRHLLLITVDTLRADHLGSYGSTLELTPELDRLAATSVRFASTWAAAPSTLPSVAAILSGEHPARLGVPNNLSRFPEHAPTLATLLRGRGWRTGAVVSNFVLRKKTGLSTGFERYDERMIERESRRRVPERRALDTTDAAIEMLGHLTTPDAHKSVFLWVHYQDPHGPYVPPPGYRERELAREQARPDGMRRLPRSETIRGIGAIPSYQFRPPRTEVAFYRAGYQAEVRYADEQIGRLLAAWEQHGLARQGVVVFTADHGEGMGEQEYWFAHGEYLSAPLLHVPLLIRAPGLAPAVRDDAAGHVDLLPTIAALLGFAPPAGAPGRDLLAPDAATRAGSLHFAAHPPESTVSRYGLARDGVKLVVSLTAEGEREQVSGLDDPADRPLELEPAPRDRLRTELAALRAASQQGPVQPQELDADDRERLRELGYAED